MATIQDKCMFKVKPDQIIFTTRTNGDRVSCKGMHINKDNAAALSYFIQAGKNLKVVIKEA